MPGDAPDSAGRAGASPEPTGAVRSWANTDSRAGQPLTTEASRRSGTGLSAMLLPELQRLAQSMGIQGTGRMRKGQVIAAIEERQRTMARALAGLP
jgi:transcription termination factor Rho